MKAEIVQKINAEIINKVVTNLYSFSYTDEEPGEDILVLRIEKTKITIKFEMDLEKDKDGLINNCSIKAVITNGKNIRDNGNE